MANTRISIPIRLKIAGLIAGALICSFVAYLYVGTNLIVEDKVSYIYDYNLSQVKAAAEKINNRITEASIAAGMLGRLVGSKELSSGDSAAFEVTAKRAAMTELMFFKIREKAFKLHAAFGEKKLDSSGLMEKLGWTEENFKGGDTQVGTAVSGQVPIAGRTTDAYGEPMVYLGLVKFDGDLIDVGRYLEMHFYDSMGKRLFTKRYEGESLDEDITASFVQSLLHLQFPSGVQDWAKDQKSFIVGYQRIASNKLLVVGFIPKEIAFAASQAMIKKSAVLGISILLLAIGLTMLFGRRLTGSLKQMWFATRKVSEGDYSCRVKITKSSRDEVTDLAESFNSMADKINELMIQTAEKARMEKELALAQAVQTRFFPAEFVKTPSLSLSGKALSATECAGDWWHHTTIGDLVFVAVGDVTGHGVSAALVTAAVHGAYSVLVQRYKETSAVPTIKEILDHLNSAVWSASHGESSMTMVLGIIQLSSGKMQIGNASHHPIYRCRKPEPGEPAESQALKLCKPLVGGKCNPLGQATPLDVEVSEVQLEQGDTLLWYTDGLIESNNPKGEHLSKKDLVKMMARLSEKNSFDADGICKDFYSETMTFFGDTAKHLPDDVTMVFTAVPLEAPFHAPAPTQVN